MSSASSRSTANGRGWLWTRLLDARRALRSGKCAKLYVLPHANTALAGVDCVGLHARAFAVILGQHKAGVGFDMLADQMRCSLSSIHADMTDTAVGTALAA